MCVEYLKTLHSVDSVREIALFRMYASGYLLSSCSTAGTLPMSGGVLHSFSCVSVGPRLHGLVSQMI